MKNNMNTNKITINTVFGSVLWESTKDSVKEAVIEKYDRDADLRDADLWQLPGDFINQSSRDIFSLFLNDSKQRCLSLNNRFLKVR